jgi:hypothetical protein
MTDADLRERLQREGSARMSEVRAPSTAPPLLGRRVRSRQVATVVGAIVTVVAVSVVSVVAVGVALRHHSLSSAPTITGPEGDRTSFLYGTRVRYPRNWSLLQLSGRGNPGPLFQLSNFEPSRVAKPECGGTGSGVPARGVLLVVARSAGGPAGSSRWPVQLRPAGAGCLGARWTIRGVAFQAWAVVGAESGAGDRRHLLEAYRSIRFPLELTPGAGAQTSRGGGPAFVVASGYVLGRPASWVARAEGGGVCLDRVVGSGPVTNSCLPVHARDDLQVVGTGPWATVIGTVSRRARSVEAELPDGETVLGEVVPAPPLLHAPFDFFVVELPIQSRGDVRAEDASGNVIGRHSFDSPPLPVVAHGGLIGKRWLLLDREQSNGVRCLDFDKGVGDQGTICPTAVPAFRDVQAAVMPLANGRKLVVAVASRRVAYVQVQFLNARFVPGRMISIPKVFRGEGALLPPIDNLFTIPIQSTDGALVVAFDSSWNPIDGLPLGTAGGFGD